MEEDPGPQQPQTTPRIFEAPPAPLPSSLVPSPSGWRCSACGHENPPEAAECVQCQAMPRSSPEPSAPVEPPPAPNPWKHTVSIQMSHIFAIAIGAAFLSGFAAHAAFFSAPAPSTLATGAGQAPTTQSQTQGGQAQGGSSRVQVPNGIDDDYAEGSKNAKVQFIEFSDFQCPFCRRFYAQTLPDLKKDYIDTGKILFVYRDFPLDQIHPGARPWAIAAECAREQSKFREMHNKIFDEQNKQGQGTINYGGLDEVKRWAQAIGLDTAKFNACLDSQKYNSEVEKDLQDGLAASVGGTPTFFIGNAQRGFVSIVGAQPTAALRQTLDQELAAA